LLALTGGDPVVGLAAMGGLMQLVGGAAFFIEVTRAMGAM
jgi:hypothetical protein